MGDLLRIALTASEHRDDDIDPVESLARSQTLGHRRLSTARTSCKDHDRHA